MVPTRKTRSYLELCDAVQPRANAWLRSALEDRFGRRAVARALADGILIPALPEVLISQHGATDTFARIKAASLWAGPRCGIGGMAAAFLHGALTDFDGPITLVAPHEFKRAAPRWIRIKRSRYPFTTTTVRSIAVVDPVECVLEVWDEAPPGRRTGAVLDCMRELNVSRLEIATRISVRPRPHVSRQFRAFLSGLAAGTTSFLEHRARSTVLNGDEFRDFVWQHPVTVGSTTYTVDAFHPTTRVAVEFDGASFHNTSRAVQHDKQRDVDLATQGIQTLRFTYSDVESRPEWCKAMIRRTLAARSVQASAPHPDSPPVGASGSRLAS